MCLRPKTFVAPLDKAHKQLVASLPLLVTDVPSFGTPIPRRLDELVLWLFGEFTWLAARHVVLPNYED